MTTFESSASQDCMGLINSTMQTEEPLQETEVANARNKRKRRASDKPRSSGRPFKKISAELLHEKIEKMEQQKKVWECKVVLLQERLDKHYDEKKKREQEADQDEQ